MKRVELIRIDKDSHYLVIENSTYDELELISSIIEQSGGDVIGFDVGEGVHFYWSHLDEHKLKNYLNDLGYTFNIINR